MIIPRPESEFLLPLLKTFCSGRTVAPDTFPSWIYIAVTNSAKLFAAQNGGTDTVVIKN